MHENITSMFALIVYNVANRKNSEWERQMNSFISAFNKNGIDVVPCDNDEAIYYINKFRDNVDFVFMWDRDATLAETLEMMRIPCLNNARAIRVSSDRALVPLILNTKKIPTLKTIVPPYVDGHDDYYSFPHLKNLIMEEGIRFPIVIKNRYVNRNEYNYLVTNEEYLKRILIAERKKPIVIEPFVPLKPKSSYRLYIVNGKYITGAERIAASSFVHSPSRGTTYSNVKHMPKKAIKYAKKAAKALGCLFAGVDVVRLGRKYYVVEVNPSMRTTLIELLTKVDVADEIANCCAKKYKEVLRKN